MKRSDVIKEIARQDGFIVSNLGYPSRELYAYAESERNFYMLGSMGLASSIGLGIALSQKKRIFVIDGDGSILMNLGSLATIARCSPANFCLIIVDNRVYGSTGNQETHTAHTANLLKIAKGAGNKNVIRVKTLTGLRRTLQSCVNKCTIIVAKTSTQFDEVPIIHLSPLQIKERFMREIKNKNRTKKSEDREQRTK